MGISKVGFRRHSSAKTLRPPGCKDAKALIGVDGRCIVAAGCKQLLGWAHDHSTDFIPFETARHLPTSVYDRDDCSDVNFSIPLRDKVIPKGIMPLKRPFSLSAYIVSCCCSFCSNGNVHFSSRRKGCQTCLTRKQGDSYGQLIVNNCGSQVVGLGSLCVLSVALILYYIVPFHLKTALVC